MGLEKKGGAAVHFCTLLPMTRALFSALQALWPCGYCSFRKQITCKSLAPTPPCFSPRTLFKWLVFSSDKLWFTLA